MSAVPPFFADLPNPQSNFRSPLFPADQCPARGKRGLALDLAASNSALAPNLDVHLACGTRCSTSRDRVKTRIRIRLCQRS